MAVHNIKRVPGYPKRKKIQQVVMAMGSKIKHYCGEYSNFETFATAYIRQGQMGFPCLMEGRNFTSKDT